MLPYFRTYAFIAYVLGMAVPVLLITAISQVTGFYIVYTIPGLISAILLLFIGLQLAKRIVTRLADKKAQEMIDRYNVACDPQAFVTEAQKIVGDIRPPYDEAGSWFLSFYALALDDLQQRNEAVRIGQAMLSSVQLARDPQTKATLLVNIEPLVQRLFGAEMALEVVRQAQQEIEASNDPASAAQLNFLSWEQGILEAIRDGNDVELVRRFSEVRTNARYPMRLRVEDALLEATIHKSRHDAARERECLEFIVANGNFLPEVELATQRLRDMM